MSTDPASAKQLTASFKWELLGDDVVALDSDGGRVFRLTGPSAAVARYMLNGTDHGLTSESYDETMAILIDEGLVTVDVSPISRRRMISVGAGALAGISILMLPTAAAAASGGGGDPAIGSSYSGYAGDGVTAPVNVQAVPGDSQVTVSWNAVANATSYRVYKRETNALNPNTYTLAWSGSGTSTIIGTLVNGTSYDFIVVAVQSGLVSGQSASASATPVASPLATPMINSITANAISWT